MDIPNHILDVFEQATCLFTTSEVNQALERMAVDIHQDFSQENPVILCVMIGGLVPLGNLLPRLDFPLELDYVQASRYQGGVRAKELIWRVEPKTDLSNRSILIVDDILDGGVTLKSIGEYCLARGAKSVKTAVLVDKQAKRVEDGLQQADYVGLTVEDHFIFGYGMDYENYLRNAPGIYVVAPQHESTKS